MSISIISRLTIFLSLVFATIGLFGVQTVWAGVEEEQCCIIFDGNQAKECVTKPPVTVCKEVCTEWKKGQNFDLCLKFETPTQKPCISQSICLEKIPGNDATIVEWKGDLQTTAVVGEQKKITITVTPKPLYTLTKLSCVNCSSDFTLISVSGNTITLTLDTLSFYKSGKQDGAKYKLLAIVNGIGTGEESFSTQEVKITFDVKNQSEKEQICAGFGEATCKQQAALCFFHNGECLSKTDGAAVTCFKLSKNLCGEGTEGSQQCAWDTVTGKCLTKLEAGLSNQYKPPSEGISKDLFPPCAFAGTCRDINDLLQVAINAAKVVLGFIGMLAFVVFVYGGIRMIFSFGNEEAIKAGRQAMIAAVIGMAISFGAYVLVNFVLDALSVGSEFRGIK